MPTRAATGASTQSDTAGAVAEGLKMASTALGGSPPTLGVIFASPRHDLLTALASARRAAPDAAFVGCTTAGEITERGLTRGGVAGFLPASAQMPFRLPTAKSGKAHPARAPPQPGPGH